MAEPWRPRNATAPWSSNSDSSQRVIQAVIATFFDGIDDDDVYDALTADLRGWATWSGTSFSAVRMPDIGTVVDMH